MASPLSSNISWELANPKWAQAINPVLANPIVAATIVQNFPLVAGVNTIPHGLGRQMQGWFLVDVQGPATVYRSGALNQYYLTLTSSAVATVSIGVF